MTDLGRREACGLDFEHHGTWMDDEGGSDTNRGFVFAALGDPQIGISAAFARADGQSGLDAEGREDLGRDTLRLNICVKALNRLRPSFVMAMGDIVHQMPGSEPERRQRQIDVARSALFRLSPSIPLLTLPGNHDVGELLPPMGEPEPSDRAPQSSLTAESLVEYQRFFGADYYGFWVQGTRFLVINSSLMLSAQAAKDHGSEALLDRRVRLMAEMQDAWLEEQLEQAKLAAQGVVVLSHHPMYMTHPEEPDYRLFGKWRIQWPFPLSLRRRWLPRMRHNSVRMVVSGHRHQLVVAPRPFARGSSALAWPYWRPERRAGCVEERGSDDADDADSQASASPYSSDAESDKEAGDLESGFDSVEPDAEGPQMVTAASGTFFAGACAEDAELPLHGEKLDDTAEPVGILLVRVYPRRVATYWLDLLDVMKAAEAGDANWEATLLQRIEQVKRDFFPPVTL